MSNQESVIKSNDEKVSVFGDPFESKESVCTRISFIFFDISILFQFFLILILPKYIGRTSLTDLNEDCLYSVLHWLPLKNQVGVVRVNTSWLRAAERCLKRQRALVLSGRRHNNREESGTIRLFDDNDIYLSPFILQLTSLGKVNIYDFKFFCFQFWLFFDDWKEPIESIKLTNCEIRTYLNESREEFAKSYPFHSLKSAEFYNCELDGDFLATIFRKAGHSLKVLAIDRCNIIRSDPFKYLPDSIEKLVVGQERYWKPDAITLLRNASWLPASAIKEIVFINIESELIENLAPRMISLESLKLTYYLSPRINSEFLNEFRRLKSLSIEVQNRFELIEYNIRSLKSFSELKYLKLGVINFKIY